MPRLLPLLLLIATAWPAHAATRVETARLGDIAEAIHGEAPATVASLNLVTPAVEVSARVVAVPVLPGQRVARDDVLLELDCQRHELVASQTGHRIDALTAQRRLASTQLRRAEKLVKQKNASEELVDQRRAELHRLDAELAAQRDERVLRERDVADCRLTAPFAGVVIERLLNVGDYALAGTPALRLLDDQRLEVSAHVRPRDAASLTRATRLEFVRDGQHFPLRLRALTPAQDPITRTREARLLFIGDAASSPALPGAAGRLRWQHSEFSLPANLLVRRDTRLGVFIVRDGVAHFVEIPDAVEGRPASVPAGLALDADSVIVTSGRHALRDGDPVDILAP